MKNKVIYSKEDQLKLVREAQNGSEKAMELLVDSYDRLLHRESNSLMVYGMEKEDLYQEGVIGLIFAIMNFDFDRSDNFYQYAWKCVRGVCMTALSEGSRTVKIPTYRVHELRKLHHSGEEILDTRDRLDGEKIKPTQRLDTEVFEDGGATTRLDLLVGDDGLAYEEAQERESLKRVLGEILDTLPKKEADIIRRYHGIGGEEQTYQEIADDLGCSKQNTNILYHSGMRRLRLRTRRKLDLFTLK